MSQDGIVKVDGDVTLRLPQVQLARQGHDSEGLRIEGPEGQYRK